MYDIIWRMSSLVCFIFYKQPVCRLLQLRWLVLENPSLSSLSFRDTNCIAATACIFLAMVHTSSRESREQCIHMTASNNNSASLKESISCFCSGFEFFKVSCRFIHRLTTHVIHIHTVRWYAVR
jgi:hypothetical protein